MAIINLPIRQEQSASYRTLIKGALVTSLRSVFTTQYKDAQFRNLRIDPEFSLTRVTWPAIYIKYNEREVRNAGVGHLEYFPDPNGLVRKWMHSMFEGLIEFDIITESPYDRDILADALVEVIRFGTLDIILNNFWQGIYGSVTDPYSNLAVMQQIALNSDSLTSIGESFAPSPWGAEDLPLYSTGYAIDILGGYYNSLPIDGPPILIEKVFQYPYLEDAERDDVPPDQDPNNIWLYPFAYFDEDIVQSIASAHTHEANTLDEATVKGTAVLASITEALKEDAAIVTSQANVTADDVRTILDAATTTTVGITITTETEQAVDASTETGAALVSAGQSYNSADTGRVTAQFNSATIERDSGVDSQIVAAVSASSSIDTFAGVDSGTV